MRGTERVLRYFALAAIMPLLAAQTLSLDTAAWRKEMSLPHGVAADRAAQFSATGQEISIGRWITGTSTARLEYTVPLPPKEGSVEGRFRTDNLYPHEALVRITFRRGAGRLSVLNYPLGTALQWTSFCVPIMRAPTGADSVAVSFGLSERTDGTVHFTALRVVPSTVVPELPASPSPITRARPPQDLNSGHFVRIEKAAGAWWLVDSRGKAFWSLGSVTPNDVYPDLRKLGFNSLASTHDARWWSAFNERQIAEGKPVVMQFRTVGTSVGSAYDTLVDASGANPGTSQAQAMKGGGFNHAFPDPFDPRWEASVRKRVHEIAAIFQGKAYFAGWMADNERNHRDIYRYLWSPHCAVEFGKFLRQRYGAIATLNAKWGTDFASFDDLLAKKPDPVTREGSMYEDFRLFSREVLRHFNDTVLRIIHEEDPGRLVFTNRFMIGEARDVFENLDLYSGYDAIAVNAYPSNVAAGLDSGERQYLELLHQRSGKPLLITEWSVPARDSGLYENYAHLDWSYPQTVATQHQRARQAAEYLTQLYNLPFVIGAHWFTWSDIDTKERQANRGLFDAHGKPWTDLQDAIAEVAARMTAR